MAREIEIKLADGKTLRTGNLDPHDPDDWLCDYIAVDAADGTQLDYLEFSDLLEFYASPGGADYQHLRQRLTEILGHMASQSATQIPSPHVDRTRQIDLNVD